MQAARTPGSLFWVMLLAVLGAGCSADSTPSVPVFEDTDLAGSTYEFVGLDEQASVVLQGELDFQNRNGTRLKGSWQLDKWGIDDLLPSLPNGGSLSGVQHGELVILTIQIPDSENSIGLVIEGVRDGKLVGTWTLLPEQKIKGSFEAVRKGP